MVCSTSIDGKLRIWNLKTIGLIFDSGSPSFLKAYKLGDTLNTVHNIIGADYVPNHKGYIVHSRSDDLEPSIFSPEPLHREVHEPSLSCNRLPSAENIHVLCQRR